MAEIQMTLIAILKLFLETRTSQKTLLKGKRIFNADLCAIKKFDIKHKSALLSVESETYFNKFYKVAVSQFDGIQNMAVTCNCPAAETQEVCKHGAAALLALVNKLQEADTVTIAQVSGALPGNLTLLTMKDIDEAVIRRHLDREEWIKARQLAFANRAKITTNFDFTATAVLLFKNEKFDIVIKKIGSKTFQTSCTCSEQNSELCMHRACVLLQLKFNNGEKAFDLMQDWSEYKNKLLAEYGFSINDNLTGLFDFIMTEDKPVLKILDPSVTKLEDLNRFAHKETLGNPQNKVISIQKTRQTKKRTGTEKTAPVELTKYGIGYVFNFLKTADLPFFTITPITGKLNADETKFVSNIAAVLTHTGGIEFKELPVLDQNDYHIIQLCKELSPIELNAFARTKLKVQPKSPWYYSSIYLIKPDEMDAHQTALFWQYVQQKIQMLFQLLANKQVYSNNSTNNISINTIEPLIVLNNNATMKFDISESDNFIELKASFKVNNETLPIKKARIVGNSFLINANTILLVDNQNQPEIFNSFLTKPVIKVKSDNLPELLNNVILPLQNHFEVNSQIPLTYTTIQPEPQAQLYLKESEDYLILQPIVSYDSKQVELNNLPDLVYVQQGQLMRLQRNLNFETELKDFMLHLHPLFEEQLPETDGLYFYIHYEDVMTEGWFLNCFEQIKNRQIEVFGFKNLSKFHYNLNKPKLTFNKVSSGIDWFDLQATVEFGDLSASLKDVQKAIIKKDNFVKLSDGSLGVLPQEWLNKYAALFKLADAKGKNNLHLSKLHFTIIDELYEDIAQEDILKELMEKRDKLKNFSQIKNTKIPTQIKADLRPYQKSGFNWLNFLNEFGWGGCLADDMGLGKTLQILTFIQHFKQKNKTATHLVIVPTSLIFNWEAEVDKFCTSLSILRYHGPERHKISIDNFKSYDIVITSYGTLASDISKFMNFKFDYIILDESQSIKNPETKRYKAVRLLKSQNRLALTGTPIENNTFDLYAQLNFLNPGMLGSIEFFREQYANPIDKHNDQERVAELKRIVFPFVLRRTKELVAKDLPEKTETILYCEMGPEQRKVYEAFRDEYRFKILDKINSEGMSKAGMYILEGLMKLRQICDSPVLLKDAEDYGHESVKLRELMKHITERTGNHKILVFSQFLMMLHIVRKQLKTHKIGYAYLDGSTTPAEREESVRTFQTDDSCRVFLVSLKAGGMGLNLTAADYVFLIDPWWNPAVEQQAIDRTHRIGQVNHVFAYKMICKDSVEEKILALQQKKKTLAADLISTDKGFIKNLSKTDVEYLFS